MAAEGIQIRVTSETISKTLDAIERVAENPLPIMRDISVYMVQRGQRHIETETGPDGKWPRLSPRTAAKRVGRKLRGTGHILRVSGRLYSSITGEASATEAIAGSNAVYAAVQQLGGTVNIPERQQEIHLGKTNRGKRFVKASAKRKETRSVTIGAHTVTIPARGYLYLDEQDFAEIERIASDGFRREAEL